MAGTMSRETLQTNLSTQSLGSQRDTLENAADTADNIRVFVRVRPPTEREQVAGSQQIVSIDTATSSVLLRGDQPRTFTFDGVLGDDSSQDEVFELVGRKIGSSCLSGYNSSVYVYGQTGVGKTYTLFGPVSSVQSMHFDERRGLICRILDHVFAEMHRRRACTEGVSYLCRCSFLEIYKEQITDLLEPGNTNLQVREDMNRGVYVERLSEPTVWSLTEAFQALWKGLQQRHIGATQLNERSSRSHAVFTLAVEVAQTRAGVTSTRIARMSLIDLAGSERQTAAVDASGFSAPYQALRVKEAGAINKSLSALTNVILSLSRAATSRRRSSGGDGRRPYVHYRDSKLTFLLRDSLGGNSKTVIVANMSPAAICFAETLSTLKFAARAKHIKCAAVRNEEYSGTVESLMEEVKGLRQQLAQLSDAATFSRDLSTGGFEEDHGGHEEDENQVLYSRKRVRRLEVLLAAALERERLADHRRHQLHRLAEFLEDLDFRKEQFMRTLHKDYLSLTAQIEESRSMDVQEDVAELSSKFVGFGQLLGNLIPGTRGQCSSSEAWKDAGTFHIDVADACKMRQASSSPQLKRGTPQASQRGGALVQGADYSLSTNASGGFADEENFLREENARLRQQLDQHPEVSRLASENRVLRAQLSKIDALSKSGRSRGSRCSRGGRHKQDNRHENFLNKTLRSAILGMSASKDSLPRGGTNHEDDLDFACDNDVELNAIERPVTSEMMQRIVDGEEDTLRAWVHFQKMAKEVEELIRAKENLATMLKDAHSGEGKLLDTSLPSKSDVAQAKSTSLRNSVDPQVLEDLVQSTNDALALAQSIIDSRGVAQPPAGAKQEDVVLGVTEGGLQKNQRSSSVPHLSSSVSMGTRNRSIRALSSTNEDFESPRGTRYPLSGLHNTPAAIAASATRGASPRAEPSQKVEVRQAMQKVNKLHGTLDLVNCAYNDAYDQFQRLREEYESRLEECQFFELQCSRLDMHCQELADRLYGNTSVRSGVGSFSATGFSPASASSQQRRCFSLSSLRDVTFWEQRFQELSQLTGIDEAERAQLAETQLHASASATVTRSASKPKISLVPGTASSGAAPAVAVTQQSGQRLGILSSSSQTLLQSISRSNLPTGEEEPKRQCSSKRSSSPPLYGEMSARNRPRAAPPSVSASGRVDAGNIPSVPPAASSTIGLTTNGVASTSSGSIVHSSSREGLVRPGSPPLMLAISSPRVAAARTASSSLGASITPNSSTTALGGPTGSSTVSAAVSAALSTARAVRSNPPAQRSPSGLRSAQRLVAPGSSASRGSTLAYPTAAAALSQRSGS